MITVRFKRDLSQRAAQKLGKIVIRLASGERVAKKSEVAAAHPATARAPTSSVYVQSGETVSVRRPGPYLGKLPVQVVAKPPFKTGTLIPETGIYKVIHGEHRLPHEVILFEGEQFPRCSKCRDKVSFELVYPAAEVHAGRSFRVVVHELPVLEPESSAA